MFFGLFNATVNFQSYINKILAKKFNILVIVDLNDIFIYIEEPGQPHINVVCWVLKKLRKKSLFTNLKKCFFHKNKICFLRYIILAQEIQIEDERIKELKNWPEPKSVYDIQVFLGFANFYQRFI